MCNNNIVSVTSGFHLRLELSLIRFVMIFILLIITKPIKLSATDSNCPRKVEVMAYGYKDAPPGTYGKLGKLTYQRRWIDDNSFDRVVFLNEFRKLFISSRLRLNIKDKPEYSLTATFSQTTDLENDGPMSCLTIVFAFNGGRECGEGLSYSWIDQRYPCAYHHQKLLTWSTTAPGHDLSAHIPLMAGKINIREIENTMTSFEQIPVSAEFRKTPEWCNEPGLEAQSSGTLEIVVDKFKTAAPPMDGAVHRVRIVVSAQKGTISNGTFMTEDPNAKVFTITPSEVSTSSAVQIFYVPPDGEDNSDVITVYNSCDVYLETEVPLNETKIGSMLLEVENQCGWEGIISMSESMEAGENQSILAALTPGGEYNISKNWKVQIRLKRTGDRFNSVLFETDKALLLNFEDEFDQTMFRMEREGRRIEGRSRESASSGGRSLSASECNLKLLIKKEEGTYRLYGNIAVEGISVRGKDEMEIKVRPINEDIDEGAEGTTGIDKRIEINGKFKPEGPENLPVELKGRKDLMEDIPKEFREFLEELGGKQSNIINWNLKRKSVIIRKG